MQPSSLVFLVLIAIWAAYLLQHWVRRREHLATARSVDRFSDAMHVLERRAALPDVDLSVAHPRSYSVSPARPSRPEVVVKRVQSPLPKVPVRPAAAVRPTRVFHVLAGVSARRLRGLSLLASLLLTVVVSSLVALSILLWWSVLVAVAVLLADVAWLRHVAVAEREAGWPNSKARGSADGASRPGESHLAEIEPNGARNRATGSAPHHEPAGAVAVGAALEVGAVDVGAADVGAADVGAVDVGAVEVGAAEVGDLVRSPGEAGLSGWAPVPVPPPTYTLKAKAAPSAPATMNVPGAAVESGPEAPWSLDGLVYDCELDELVERRRVVGG